MKTLSYLLSALGAVIVTAGCSSIPNPYIPQQLGQVMYDNFDRALEVQITADRDQAIIGKPIHFDIRVRNVSDQALWVPKDPDVCFHFVYSNGIRDNYLEDPMEARFYSKNDAVLLRPGQELTRNFEVKTYYFERTGITEFQAVVTLAKNTNASLSPSWDGRIESNGFGVLVKSAGRDLNIGGLFSKNLPKPTDTKTLTLANTTDY